MRVTIGLVVLGGALLGCHHGLRQTARDRLALLPAPDQTLGASLIDADRIVAGELTAVTEAPDYESLGAITFGAKAVVRLAYNATIRVDSMLLGHAGHTVSITFFAPPGAVIPRPGTTAIWVLHRRALWRLKQCSEQLSLTSTACPYDVGLALDADVDVRPLAEWSDIDALLEALGLGPARPQPRPGSR